MACPAKCLTWDSLTKAMCLLVNLHPCKFLFQNLDALLNLRTVPCQLVVECVHQLSSFGEYLRIAIKQERKNNCFSNSQKLTTNYQK